MRTNREARPGALAVVIGAGPYGLAIAAHLQRSGVPIRIFGEPMWSWLQAMPRGMFLKSAPDSSDIASPVPGRALADYYALAGLRPLADGEPVPIEVFSSYGLWFAEQHALEIESSRVLRVARAGNGFDVVLGSGEELRAATVVVASGHVAHAYTPTPLTAGLGVPNADGLLSHSAHHSDLGVFRGRRVAVVGAGQSALESAALLRDNGACPILLVRTKALQWTDGPAGDLAHSRRWNVIRNTPSPLGDGLSLRILHDGAPLIRFAPAAMRLGALRRALGPAGAWWLQERVDNHVEARLGTAITTAAPIGNDTVRLTLRGTDARRYAEVIDVDHVIAATGYHFDLDSIAFLDASLRNSIARTAGYPRLSGSFESSEPGLYFAGLGAAATFGPLLRFVCGTALASRRIARAIESPRASKRDLRSRKRLVQADVPSSAAVGQ